MFGMFVAIDYKNVCSDLYAANDQIFLTVSVVVYLFIKYERAECALYIWL